MSYLQGKGQTVQMKRMGPMVTQQISTCYACKGAGKTLRQGADVKNVKVLK